LSADPLVELPGFPTAPGLPTAAPVELSAFGCFPVAGSGVVGAALEPPEPVDGPSAKAGDTSMQSTDIIRKAGFMLFSARQGLHLNGKTSAIVPDSAFRCPLLITILAHRVRLWRVRRLVRRARRLTGRRSD
jgi:hypothetical protein